MGEEKSCRRMTACLCLKIHVIDVKLGTWMYGRMHQAVCFWNHVCFLCYSGIDTLNLKCLYFSLAARHRQSQPPQRPHSRSPGSSTATAAEQEDAPQRSPNPLHKGLYKMEMGGGDRDLDDTSILRAREHVMGAEAAEEEEADQALDAAREHVWRLEEEAEADARRARIKQHHAAEVSKRGKMLGPDK
ncbi:hypothetical protein MY1884_003076 [Beauveria asiatica]